MTSYITGLDPVTGLFFVDNNGKPKLALFDNPWALIFNAGEWSSGAWQTEMSDYLSSRSSQGFTGLYVSALGNTNNGGSYDNGNTWDNVPPFVSGGDPSTGLNSTYWERVDYLITTAESYGMVVFLNIAYSAEGGGGNMESGGALYNLTQTQYTNYGTAVADRYKSQPNIIWMYGNDYYAEYETQFGYIRSAVVATGDTHNMSLHVYPESTSRYDIETGEPQSTNGTAFGYDYAQINWVYTYNVTYWGVELAWEEAAYYSIPKLPAIWGDGYFYDSGVSIPTDQQMRQMAWWAISSGARGCNNGSNDIWPWDSGSPAAVTTGSWYTTGAGVLSSTIQGLTGFHLLMPDTSSTLVTSGRGTHASGIETNDFYDGGTDDYVTACWIPNTGRGSTLAVIYCAKTFDITISQSQMAPGYKATWLDPTDGTTTVATPGSTYNSSALGNNSAGEPDFVLILQGSLTPPGQGPALSGFRS